jgi:hypothetical protein
MNWEYQLMRDMLERANIYRDIPSPECQKTGMMLRSAARVMINWDRKLVFMEIALRKIANLENTQFNNHADEMHRIAREVLANWGSDQSGEHTEMVKEVQK